METQNYSCKKCGLTITSICSKCDRVVDVKVLDSGCIVQQTKCGECAKHEHSDYAAREYAAGSAHPEQLRGS